MLWVTKSVEKSNAESARATEAEKRLIQYELSEMTKKFNSMELKHEALTQAFHSLKERVIAMAQKQDDFQVRLIELMQNLEKFKNHADTNAGKVIKKF